MQPQPHRYEAHIQMPNAFSASVVAQAVSVDPELRPHMATRDVKAEDDFIHINISATDVKTLRTVVTSLYDFIHVSLQATAQFA